MDLVLLWTVVPAVLKASMEKKSLLLIRRPLYPVRFSNWNKTTTSV